MDQILDLLRATWVPFAWFLFGAAGIVGVLAVISPRGFSKVVTQSSRWVDAGKLLAFLDKRYDIDRYVLPYSRLLGFLVLGSVAVISWMYLHG